MARLIIEDVTLLKDEQITLQVRFKGGTTKTLVLPRLLRSWEKRQTSEKVIKEIDRLLDNNTINEIVKILNEMGYKSGEGKIFTSAILHRLVRSYKIKSRYDRLREKGLYTLEEIAKKFNVSQDTIKIWRRRGLLKAFAYDDKPEYLFEEPAESAPVKGKWKSFPDKPFKKIIPDPAKEVQYET